MASSSISVPNFIREREKDLDGFVPDLRALEAARLNGKTKRKRDFCSLFYRTRSYRSYKMPRLERKGKSRKVAALLEASQRKRKRNITYRPQRRRPALLVNTLLKPQSSPAALLDQAPIKLPTHIFHAKRMRMEQRSGFVVAAAGNGRGFKALDSMRAAGKVFVQDQSYLRPLSIRGPVSNVHSILELLNEPGSDLLEALTCMTRRSPTRDITAMFHQPRCFPWDAIGPVTATLRVDHSCSDLSVHLLLWPEPVLLPTLSTILEEVCSEDPVCRFDGLFAHPLGRIALQGDKLPAVLRAVLRLPRHCSEDALQSEHHAFFQRSTQTTTTLRNVWKSGNWLALTIQHPIARPPNASAVEMDRPPRRLRWPSRASQSVLWMDDAPSIHTTTSLSPAPSSSHLGRQRKQEEDAWERWEQSCGLLDKTPSISSLLPRLLPETQNSSQEEKDKEDGDSFPLLLSFSHAHLSPSHLLTRQAKTCTAHLLAPLASLRGLIAALEREQCVVIGSDEQAFLSMRTHRLSFPQDFPDCPAGWQYWMEGACRAVERKLRRPHNKRWQPAYRRHDRLASFAGVGCMARWLRQQVEDVRTGGSVDRQDGPEGGMDIDMDTEDAKPAFVVIRNESFLQTFKPPLQWSETETAWPALPALPQLTLVHVQLKPLGRGMPRTGCLLLLPHRGEKMHAMGDTASTRTVAGQRTALSRTERAVRGVALASETFARLEAEPNSQPSWEGREIEGRKVVGCVTSGLAPHTNLPDGPSSRVEGDRGFGAVGLAEASQLYDHFCAQRYRQEAGRGELDDDDGHEGHEGHEGQERKRDGCRAWVWFRNPGSRWLRPAMIQYL